MQKPVVRSALAAVAVLSFAAVAAAGDDGSPPYAPPDRLAQSPLFLDLSVDPAVDITIYPTFKDQETRDPQPKPLELSDEVLLAVKDEPEDAVALEKDTSAAGTYDVGIIPDRVNGCPIVGSEYVLIHTDDEDDDCNSNTSGWTGAITREGTGTTFGFCRADGTKFKRIPQVSYAVLKLGTTCPPGSYDASHHFDDEDDDNQNYHQGNIAPNQSYQGYINEVMGDTTFALCVFPPSSSNPFPYNISSVFPNLGITYGVFGAPSSLWLATGHVHTDDEDSNGSDEESLTWSPDFDISSYVYETMGAHRPNSEFNLGKVWNVVCSHPCPMPGSSYDGSNCYVATPPAGTSGFTSGGNLYYTAVHTPSCPMAGSAYDGANCYVATPPAGTTPFAWGGNLYYSPRGSPT